VAAAIRLRERPPRPRDRSHEVGGEERRALAPGGVPRSRRRRDEREPRAGDRAVVPAGAPWIVTHHRGPPPRVATNDGRMAYFLPRDAQLTGLPRTRAALERVDFVLLAPFGPSMESTPAEIQRGLAATRALVAGREPVLADSGHALYRTP
jgi:hypothetical protein